MTTQRAGEARSPGDEERRELTGVLTGPLAHLVLHDPAGVSHGTNAGTAALRLEDGSEIALELGGATVYGAPPRRWQGTPVELAKRVPSSYASFVRSVSSGDGIHDLEAREIPAGTAVVAVADVVRSSEPASYRDSAEARLERARPLAVAWASRDWAVSAMGEHRPRHFLGTPPPSWSPRALIDRFTVWALVFAAIAGGILYAAWRNQSLILFGIALVPAALALYWFGHGLDLAPSVAGLGASSSTRTGRLTPSRLFGRALMLYVLAWVLVMGVGGFWYGETGDQTPLLNHAVPILGAVAALILLWRLTRLQRDPMRGAWSFLRTPEARADGRRCRFSGRLWMASNVAWHESLESQNKLLWATTVTGADGHARLEDQHDRWLQLQVETEGPAEIIVVTDDGTYVLADAVECDTTVAGRRWITAGESGGLAVREARFQPGDEATLIGLAEPRGEGWAVRQPRSLLLGSRTQLGWAVARLLLIRLALLGLAVIGLAVAWTA